MFLFPNEYATVDGLWMPNHREHLDTFAYSDGDDFESQIGRIVAGASDRSLFSQELIESIWDWRSACHLSPVRANVLRPLEAICRKRVLELGSGCGIITRYLGELGSDVVALEASVTRAMITHQRTADLENVKVVCERIEDFHAVERFDVVTMIGVLQYARLFSRCGEYAERELLQNAARQLNDGGVLVIAIQNKLGLKYFSGFPEPNVDTPYYGIEDRYASDTVIRFGLDELRALLTSVGLPEHEVLLPLPDYHMPVSILSSGGAALDSGLLGQTLLELSVVRDRSRPDWNVPWFSLERGWRSVFQNGLATDLANSFLVVAGKCREALGFLREGGSLAWHYSVERHPAFATAKSFQRDGDSVAVNRHRLRNDPPPNVPVTHRVGLEMYVPGRLLWSGLVDILNRPGWTVAQVCDWSRHWLDALRTEANLSEGITPSLDFRVPGAMFDSTPMNCIATDDRRMCFIDEEWEIEGSLALSYLLVRGLVGSFLGVASCAQPSHNTPVGIVELVVATLRGLDTDVADRHIEDYIVQESTIQNWIHKGRDTGVSASWNSYIRSAKLAVRADPRTVLAHIDEGQAIERHKSILEQKEFQLAGHEGNLRAFEADLKRREDWLSEKEPLLARHAENLRAVEVDLKRRETWVSEKESQLARHEENLRAVETDLKRRETWVSGKESQLARHEDNLRALETDVKRRQTWLSEKEIQLAGHEENLRGMKACLEQRELHLAGQLAQVAVRASELDARESGLPTKVFRRIRGLF